MRIRSAMILAWLVGLSIASCGAIGPQEAEEILSGVVQTAAAGVTFVPATADIEAIVQQTLVASTASAAAGSISGQLSYPSEFIPPLRVVAFRLGTTDTFSLNTVQNQTTYELANLPVGTYHVVAFTPDGALAGGYSRAVPCGLTAACTDHSLIDVSVNVGQATVDINPADWYAPVGSFPAIPGAQPSTDNIPTNTPEGGLSGTISGGLGYPSEFIPPMALVAFRIGGAPNEYYYVLTQQNQDSYQIGGLPSGTYHVVAYPMLDGSTLAGGYSQAVLCGLNVNCNDHSLIPVNVTAGQNSPGVDPVDWYSPPGTFPSNPLP